MTETGSSHGNGVNQTMNKSPVMSYKSLLEWQHLFQEIDFQIITDDNDIKTVKFVLMSSP
jgi:hypothetical protein